MSKMYHPSTPLAARVREGHFGEAILPQDGIQPGPVYVYDAGIRIWHWVTALAIVVLCVTGYFIGSPPPSIGGEAYEHYLFGWIRFTHYIPFWSIGWWKEVFAELGWYLFMAKPKEYVGHNPLAHLAMFLMFLLPMIVLLLTGFALYAEGAGIQSGWYSVFGWVFRVLGDSMTVHTWHHVAMWVVIIFALIHMYMAIREDMTHRQTTISSMISGWRFYR